MYLTILIVIHLYQKYINILKHMRCILSNSNVNIYHMINVLPKLNVNIYITYTKFVLGLEDY